MDGKSLRGTVARTGGAVTENRGHGRTERRTTHLAPLGEFLGYPAIDFPHATYAFVIERHTTHHTSARHVAHTRHHQLHRRLDPFRTHRP